MNLQEFGKRLQLIREDVLQLSQTELAEKLNSSQVILSRLERGIGADIKSFFVLLNYFTSNSYPTHILFGEHFILSEFAEKKISKTSSTKKKAPKKDEIFKEFGLRVRTVREDILQISQHEFAKGINCKTNLYSRLELGQGGNVNIVFDIVNALEKHKLDGSMLFYEPFDLNSLKREGKQPVSMETIVTQLKELQKSFDAEIKRIIAQIE